MKYLSDFLKALGRLSISLVGSRKAFYQNLSKLMAAYLIYSLTEGNQRITVYAISTIADFVYFGIVTFEKVRSNINIGNRA